MEGKGGESACASSVPGNDLGRVLRWGAGYSGEDPLSVLVSVDEADAVLMDRWTILLDGHEASSAENGLADMEPPKVPVCLGEGVAAVGPPHVTLPHASRDFSLSQPHPGAGDSTTPFTVGQVTCMPGAGWPQPGLHRVPCCLLLRAGSH